MIYTSVTNTKMILTNPKNTTQQNPISPAGDRGECYMWFG